MNMKKYEITTEEYTAVVKARKATQNKRIARRLQVIELRYEGKTSKEIAEKLDMNWMYVSEIVKQFKTQGLKKLSEQFSNDYILLICDGAAWHKSNELIIPENIELFFIPPYTPEMNPIEQIWKEIRKRGFQNEIFDSLEAVVDKLCLIIKELPATVIKSITGRKWILSIF